MCCSNIIDRKIKCFTYLDAIKAGEVVEEVSAMVEAISSIAQQTNLLALNAAIEAATAGSQAILAQDLNELIDGFKI